MERLEIKNIQSPEECIFKVINVDKNTFYYCAEAQGRIVTFATIIDWLIADDSNEKANKFVKNFTEILFNIPFQSYFFETPSIASKTQHTLPFQFAVIDAPALNNIASDETAFHSKFKFQSAKYAVSFSNISGDAQLIVPTPIDKNNMAAYSDLASFVRRASFVQIRNFWRCAGWAIKNKFECFPEQKIWISTSGLGVNWLHLRLDSKPKYYKSSFS